MYTVKEVANLLGITEHTVRFYTDKGLVPDLQRDKNNIRIFDAKSIYWLQGAKNLKSCGMSISNIKKYIDLCSEGNNSIEERHQMIQEQRKLVQAQLEEMKLIEEFVMMKEQHYQDILAGTTSDNTNPTFWNDDSDLMNHIRSCPLIRKAQVH